MIVQNTEFVLGWSLGTNCCLLSHTNSCRPTLAPPSLLNEWAVNEWMDEPTSVPGHPAKPFQSHPMARSVPKHFRETAFCINLPEKGELGLRLSMSVEPTNGGPRPLRSFPEQRGVQPLVLQALGSRLLPGVASGSGISQRYFSVLLERASSLPLTVGGWGSPGQPLEVVTASPGLGEPGPLAPSGPGSLLCPHGGRPAAQGGCPVHSLPLIALLRPPGR